MGPKPTQSIGGSLYTLTAIDVHSRKADTMHFRVRSTVPELIMEYVERVEHQTGRRVIEIRLDGADKHKSTVLLTWAARKGITLGFTAARDSKQNGLIERFKRTLGDAERCMLAGGRIPAYAWAEAQQYATFIYNCRPHSFTRFTPYQLWYGRVSDVSGVRTFGCVV